MRQKSLLFLFFLCTAYPFYSNSSDLLLFDIHFSDEIEHQNIFEFCGEFEKGIEPFTYLVSQESLDNPSPEFQHGTEMFKIILSNCPNCLPNITAVDLSGAIGRHVETFEQMPLYKLLQSSSLQKGELFVANFSIRTGGFPYYKSFKWHDELLQKVKEANALLVFATGNKKSSTVTSQISELSSYIPLGECQFLAFHNSFVPDILYKIGFLNARIDGKQYSCERSQSLSDWVLLIGVVDDNNRSVYSTPGDDVVVNESFVSIKYSDINNDIKKVGTSEATAMVSGLLLFAQLRCKDKSLVKELFFSSVSKDFYGYSADKHGRGVFRKQSFLDSISSACS